MRNKVSEYKNFNQIMRDLLKVPHSEIKAKLDAEKKLKKDKKDKHDPKNSSHD